MFAGVLSVALRKESVDRNCYYCRWRPRHSGSLSARRAWIEIATPTRQADKHVVALRKESVDRNMPRENLVNGVRLVALRKESVDRNVFLTLTVRNVPSRSPQGERG